MQSQQKKVKWSRGETASALEERTDTGITEVSVARMINCMTDIYGNISRRPALKPIPLADRFQTEQFITLPNMYFSDAFIPFYISEDDFILLAIGAVGIVGYRIKNNVIVSANHITGTRANIDIKSIKYAQQNNYMVVTSKTGDMKITINIIDETRFSISDEIWTFTAGWYAPNGTQTKAVTLLNAIWNKDKQGFTDYTYTDKNGQSTVWSYIDSGLTTPAQAQDLENQIPDGSIIQFPKIGAYMRYEGTSVVAGAGGAYNWYFQDKIFTGGLKWSESVPSTGTYIKAQAGPFSGTPQVTVKIYENGTNTSTHIINNLFIMVSTGNGFIEWNWLTLDGSEGGWSTVSDAKIGIYGPLLTPAAKSDATDTTINVEYGYVNLTPATDQYFPSPSVVTFSDQRLWTAGWKLEDTADQYALVIGSQIAKYTDFKNDYNLANEAITLDILTKYREDVLHLVDYNGLKIFTTGAEWAYVDGRPVKQSTNGSLASCEPIVFGSLCLYADQTGNQIRAMQYELQNNIFDSTIINQMTPGDLIWQPTAMAQYEDKANNTGRHLFVLNQAGTNIPRIATSNFVPGNQAAIWSRWEFQTLYNVTNLALGTDVSLVVNIVNTKKQPIFMVFTKEGAGLCCMPAILDFEAEADMLVPLDNSNKYRIYHKGGWWDRFIPNATVAVYSNGVYQYETTTDENGVLARVPTGLSNVTVGMPINSRVVSHPIDVGGKTKTVTKRIAKVVMSVRNTEPGSVTINSKTGYMNQAKDTINFYGVTGMKREIIYTITNNKGARFTIESLTMNIEYGTLIS